MNHPHLKSPILISSKPPLVSPELQDSKEGTFTISSRTRGTQIKEPTRSARRQREPAESRQTDIHLSVPAPGEAAGLRRSVHAPETRRRPAGACGEARRAEAEAAASSGECLSVYFLLIWLTPRETRWLLYLGASGARGNDKGSFFGILELRGGLLE